MYTFIQTDIKKPLNASQQLNIVVTILVPVHKVHIPPTVIKWVRASSIAQKSDFLWSFCIQSGHSPVPPQVLLLFKGWTLVVDPLYTSCTRRSNPDSDML